MEQKNKNKKNNNNANTDKKKKFKSFKKYSFCFPFHINIKILKDQKHIIDLINKIQNLSSIKPTPFLFGLNTTLNCIQKPQKEEKLIFIFYKEKIASLYDIILFRTKFIDDLSIYFIDEEWQKKFLEIFKIKKLLSFVLLKNDSNKEIFNEIKNSFKSYNINNENNREISKNNIQELTIEEKK